MTIQLGILLSLACAFATNVGFLLKHRGACAAPDVSLRHPLASAAGLFRSKWFTLGMLVALCAWVLHVGALALGTFLVLSPQLGSHEHHGVVLGTAAGILFGVSDVAIKALTGMDGVMGVLLSPWLAVTIVASVIAFYASARGLQDGEAVPVIASTSTAANVSTIMGGIVVFGDPMPGDAVGIALQMFAFVLVVVAALIVPPPLRAAEANARLA